MALIFQPHSLTYTNNSIKLFHYRVKNWAQWNETKGTNKYSYKLTSSFDDTESSLSERYMAMCGMCPIDI